MTTAPPTTYAWGHATCKRCDRGGIVVVHETGGLAHLAFPCGKCGAPMGSRWTWRGGSCATEAAAVARAETWQQAALTEHSGDDTPPRRGA